jgi:signal transduction histidine kinase
MAQEAFTNILKHARATAVDLAISVDTFAQQLVIRIADNGIGIAGGGGRGASGSHGLASMRHRVTALGGTWEIQRGQSTGTILTARLPLEQVLERDAGAAEKPSEWTRASGESAGASAPAIP